MWAKPKIATAPAIPAAKFNEIKKSTVKRLESAPNNNKAIKVNTVATSKEAKIVVKFFIIEII